MLADYDFELPPERIAQTPPTQRGKSRLLVLDRQKGTLLHRQFSDLPEFLDAGDLLVLNDSRVFPARLRFRRQPSGGRGELLCLQPEAGTHHWRAIGRPGKALRIGEVLALDDDETTAHPIARQEREVIVEFRRGDEKLPVDDVFALCEQHGEIPLPPYIDRSPATDSAALDRERYQTVYAAQPGSAAAPTAGLHFTSEILETVQDRGILTATVTLHVGLGTFQPLTAESFEAPTLHRERIVVDESARKKIECPGQSGRRIVAAGTTTARVLESLPIPLPKASPYSTATDLFIKPGHKFRYVDALITNFHLPRSSLLVLVSAFAGRERISAAYAEAISEKYRFYSYGDAMLIL